MKRRATKVILFLLAGAIINVGIAWGCWRYSPWSDLEVSGQLAPDEARWVSKVDLKLDRDEQILVNRFKAIGCFLHQYVWTPSFAFSNSAGLGVEITAGLPFRCLHGEIVPADADDPSAWFGKVTRGSTVHQSRSLLNFGQPVVGWTNESLRNSMPMQPIFPGFAINTIFYAAIVWMLFAVPGMIRRRVRRRRGQCAACGYSLRGTPHIEKCPECGAHPHRNLSED